KEKTTIEYETCLESRRVLFRSAEPFAPRLAAHRETGRITLRPRHAVEELLVEDGRVTGVRGSVLAADDGPRGAGSSREVTGEFEARAAAELGATGGMGGDGQRGRCLRTGDQGASAGRLVSRVAARGSGIAQTATPHPRLPRHRHHHHPAPPAHDRVRPLLVRAHPEDHREGVRALRQRAEPGYYREGLEAGALAREARRPRAGAGLPRP